MDLNSAAGRQRIIGTSEGISLLVLLFIAMPLKYMLDMPQMVRIVGMIHGMLFILYVIHVVYIKSILKWDLKTTAIVLIACVIPFAPFYVDKKYLS